MRSLGATRKPLCRSTTRSSSGTALDIAGDTVEELIDAGEHVVSIVTTTGRGRASGADVEWKHNAGVWTLSGGKIVRVIWFSSREEALEAAGMPD